VRLSPAPSNEVIVYTGGGEDKAMLVQTSLLPGIGSEACCSSLAVGQRDGGVRAAEGRLRLWMRQSRLVQTVS